jgi:hypothetical protein
MMDKYKKKTVIKRIKKQKILSDKKNNKKKYKI